jgi:hypothetical protein
VGAPPRRGPLRLLSSGSDPGRRSGQGDFQLGDEVSAYLRYAFAEDRDPVALCQLTVDRLAARGWVLGDFEEGCTEVSHFEAEPEFDILEAHDAIYVNLTYAHPRFRVQGMLELQVDPRDDPPTTLSFTVETGYPGG